MVNVYFCSSCKYNFNKCETHFEFHEPTEDLPTLGLAMCPKCHPKGSQIKYDDMVRINHEVEKLEAIDE